VQEIAAFLSDKNQSLWQSPQILGSKHCEITIYEFCLSTGQKLQAVGWVDAENPTATRLERDCVGFRSHSTQPTDL